MKITIIFLKLLNGHRNISYLDSKKCAVVSANFLNHRNLIFLLLFSKFRKPSLEMSIVAESGTKISARRVLRMAITVLFTWIAVFFYRKYSKWQLVCSGHLLNSKKPLTGRRRNSPCRKCPIWLHFKWGYFLLFKKKNFLIRKFWF